MFDRRYTIRITDRPDVVSRVLTLCQQRRCEVTALSFVAADRHRGAQLSLTVRASSRHGDRLPLWLGRLVDVLEVREAGPGAAIHRPPEPSDEPALAPAPPGYAPAMASSPPGR